VAVIEGEVFLGKPGNLVWGWSLPVGGPSSGFFEKVISNKLLGEKSMFWCWRNKESLL
jgi:hypothetical protein